MENFAKIALRFGEKKYFHYYFKEDECLYSINREKNNSIYLNCVDEDCECKSKIFNNLMTRTNASVHSHPVHKHVAEFETAYDKLKYDVDQQKTPIRELHLAALQRISTSAAGLLAWQNVRGTLYRIRSLKMPNCHNIFDLDNLLNNNSNVYETYGLIRGKPLYTGSVNGQMFFSNPELIPSLEKGFELFIDGTHGVVPYKQEQLLVVMATLHRKPRPIIYVIMSDRKESTYRSIFEFIRDGILPANNCFHSPSSITMDFEMGMRNAAKNVWKNIHVFGCNFHFCQALNKNASSFNYLLERLDNSSKHKEFLMMVMRLSLIPLEMLSAGIEAIKLYMNMDEDLKVDFGAFMKYFDHTWTKRYPPKEWCVSSQRFRTNNHCEGHNLKIKQWIPINPTPWKFLEAIKDLAFDASSEFENAKIKNITYIDNSSITPHLNLLIPQLRAGLIDELEFLSKLAFV